MYTMADQYPLQKKNFDTVTTVEVLYINYHFCKIAARFFTSDSFV